LLSSYKLTEGGWVKSAEDEAQWIVSVNPSGDELESMSRKYKVDKDDLEAALDDLELPRYEENDGYSVLYINTSRQAEDESWKVATVGIVVMQGLTITISKHETELVDDFLGFKFKCSGDCMGKDIALQLLMRSTELCIRDLYLIEQKNAELEKKLGYAMKNSLIFGFMSLEKSLVYLRTAVNGNQSVLDKLTSSEWLKDDPKRSSFLEDIVIENRQACDMAGIYTDIMSNTMDAFASIINNNLNVVMKFLTSLTLVLAIPSIVLGIFSISVPVPWSDSPYAYIVILSSALVLTISAVILMIRKKLF